MKLSELSLPAEARVLLSAAKAENHKIIQRTLEHPPRGSCPNCGGLHYLWFDVVKRGPYKILPGFNYKEGERATWLENAWYVVQHKIVECPMCNDPRIKRDYLSRKSGLVSEERDWKITFIENMEGKEAGLARAKALLAEIPYPKGWITLYGDNGVGKSGLLKAIVAQCITAGVEARYTRASDILAEIRTAYEEQTDLTEAEIMDRLTDIQVLAVDEVDRISSTAWAQSTLMNIMDRRYNKRASEATVLATNLDPEKLPGELSYLASRMRDGDRIPVGGKDLRG